MIGSTGRVLHSGKNKKDMLRLTDLTGLRRRNQAHLPKHTGQIGAVKLLQDNQADFKRESPFL